MRMVRMRHEENLQAHVRWSPNEVVAYLLTRWNQAYQRRKGYFVYQGKLVVRVSGIKGTSSHPNAPRFSIPVLRISHSHEQSPSFFIRGLRSLSIQTTFEINKLQKLTQSTTTAIIPTEVILGNHKVSWSSHYALALYFFKNCTHPILQFLNSSFSTIMVFTAATWSAKATWSPSVCPTVHIDKDEIVPLFATKC